MFCGVRIFRLRKALTETAPFLPSRRCAPVLLFLRVSCVASAVLRGPIAPKCPIQRPGPGARHDRAPAFLSAVTCLSSPEFFHSLTWSPFIAPLCDGTDGPLSPERPAFTLPILVRWVNAGSSSQSSGRSPFLPYTSLSPREEVTRN